MTNPFDADTALAGAGGRWSAEVKPHWFVQRGPNETLLATVSHSSGPRLNRTL